MAKNKGQNNANDKGGGMPSDMTDRANMQTQNKADNKKGSTNKNKNSGAQG